MNEKNFYSLYNIVTDKSGIILSYCFFEFVFSFSPQEIKIENFETEANFILSDITIKKTTFNKNNFLELLEKIEKEVKKYEDENK